MSERKTVNLALQGGGAHGAFTWGVLDALIEDGRLDFEGISGTSAGAMNAVVMADGWQKNKADGARQALETFWKSISHNNDFLRPMGLDKLFNSVLDFWKIPHKLRGYELFEIAQTPLSPYVINPLNINLLRYTLENLIDFESASRCKGFELFIAATRVYDGKIRVFNRKDITAEAVLASACLPYTFQAVEIDGEPYWDGGYSGNPPLFPFFNATKTEDIILVQINPIERRETPKSAREIMDRVSEITFNAGLLREFRAIDFVNRMINQYHIDDDGYKCNRLHRIEDSQALAEFGVASKNDTHWKFLLQLKELGRQAAQKFLVEHYDAIGHHATLDLRETFI